MLNLIASIQIQLLNDLESSFGQVAQVDIGMVAEAVESRICGLMEDVITESTNKVVRDSYKEDNQLKTIGLNNHRYQVKIQESFHKPNELIVGYLFIELTKGNTSPKLRNKEFPIKGYGKYTNIVAIVPEHFAIDEEFLSAIINTIIETCYSWLFQKTRTVIKENSLTASYLYSYIKTVLTHREDIGRNIWFVAVTDNESMFLFDEENVSHAIKKLKQDEFMPQFSPIALMSELLNMRLPFEKIAAKNTIHQGRCIDAKLSESKYFGDKTRLAVAQIGIMSNDVTIYPILTEGKAFLFLSFPSHYKEELVPLLDIHRGRIAEEYKKFISRLKKLFSLLDYNKIDTSELGNFIGNVIGGFWNTQN